MGQNVFNVALLTRVLGVHQIENQFHRDLTRINRIDEIPQVDTRIKLFTKYYEKVGRMARKIDYGVTRKYFMSKKNIYGVENELNLVEHI